MAFGSLDSHDDEHAALAEINMVPLIDVMLVLLIIFLVTAPLLTQAVNVQLPTANSAPAQATPETVTVVIGADGELWWNEEKIDPVTLKNRLFATARQAPDTPLRLRADRAARWEIIAPVFADATAAGLLAIGVETAPTP